MRSTTTLPLSAAPRPRRARRPLPRALQTLIHPRVYLYAAIPPVALALVCGRWWLLALPGVLLAGACYGAFLTSASGALTPEAPLMRAIAREALRMALWSGIVVVLAIMATTFLV